MDTVITDVVEDASVLDVPTTPDIASLDGGGDGDASSDYRRPTLERLEANPGCYSNQVSTAFDGETDFVVAQRIDTPSLPARVHAMTMWTASLSPGTVKPSIALGLCDTELPIPLVVFAGPPSADGRGVESISAFAEIIAPPDGIDADQRIQVLVWPPLTVQEGEVLYVGGRYAVEDDRASCFTICAEGAEGIVARVDADGTFEWLSTHGPLDVDATLELLAP